MPIPVFDNIKVVDENGYFTPEWKNIIESLFATLQYKLSDEGSVIPSQPNANIQVLTEAPNGTMVYDETNNTALININGDFKIIQTS